MSSAAARKILKESENLGGAGGGSFSPTRTGGPASVAPVVRRVSVALIVRTGSGRIVLAVFVLVWQRFVVGHVQADRHGRVPGVDRHRRRSLSGLLVPDLQGEIAGRHAVKAEGAVGPRDGREARVHDHDKSDHLRMDVAIHAHQARFLELLFPGGAAPVEAEVEAVDAGYGEDVVVDRVGVGELDRRFRADDQGPWSELLLLASHLAASGRGAALDALPGEPDDGVRGI